MWSWWSLLTGMIVGSGGVAGVAGWHRRQARRAWHAYGHALPANPALAESADPLPPPPDPAAEATFRRVNQWHVAWHHEGLQLDRIQHVYGQLLEQGTVDQMLRTLVDQCLVQTRSQWASVVLFDGAYLVPWFQAGDAPEGHHPIAHVADWLSALPAEEHQAWWRTPHVVADAWQDARLQAVAPELLPTGCHTLAFLPLRHPSLTAGAVLLGSTRVGAVSQDNVTVLQPWLAGAALAISRIRQVEWLEQQLVRDPLTGALNRLGLEQHMERWTAEDRPFAFVICDLDFFKRLNDTQGHQAGDAALRDIIHALQSATNPHDVVARLGGDEFVLGLADIRAPSTADTILHRIMQACPLDRWGLGMSVGAAFYPEHGSTYPELYRAADTALYQVKKSGRGRIAFADAPAAATLDPDSPESPQRSD